MATIIGVVHVGILVVPNSKNGFVRYVLIASIPSSIKTQMLDTLLVLKSL
jgi:hypothetical protein